MSYTCSIRYRLRVCLTVWIKSLFPSQPSEKFNPTVAVTNLNFMPWGLNLENLFSGQIDKVLH